MKHGLGGQGRPTLAALALVAIVAGCGGGTSEPSDGGDSIDSAVDARVGAACTGDSQCDDGTFCNGTEHCVDGACAGGTAPSCDDARECTTDHCDAVHDQCVHVARDADGDGAADSSCGGTDCDDADPTRYPGNTEVCDPAGRDEDCDPTTFGFRDADHDGWPDATCCNGTGADQHCGTDCDDTLPTAHPSEAEVCDGVDNDCDTAIDETVRATFYTDADHDGFGDPAAPTTMACFAPMDFADNANDCDDTHGEVSPRGVEVCDDAHLDEDCDGVANPGDLCNCTPPASRMCLSAGICALGTQDCLGGMWSSCSIAGHAESCNALDDDCDGLVDETLLVRCFADADGDTYPLVGAALVSLCPDDARTFVGRCPAGYTNREPLGAGSLDCDAADVTRFPGAVEVCDAVDQDCDGGVDEGLRVTCYDDGDGDGYALAAAAAHEICPPPGTHTCPMGSTSRAPAGAGTTDCDDANAGRSPSALETCNGIDDDCNGMVDDALRVACYADVDGDGYAPSGAVATMSCPDPATGACPSGRTLRAPSAGTIDCDDATATRSPSVAETCNGVDDNCNGIVDEALLLACYPDADRDGYAPSGAVGTNLCPVGGACPGARTSRAPGTGATDCDDGTTARSPSVAEICNGIDDNCDGRVDESLLVACYTDADHDGYAGSGAPVMNMCPAVGGGCPTGFTTRMPAMLAIDCDETLSTRSPAVAEACNTFDDDCDTRIDEGTTVPCYVDADSDGYPPSAAPLMNLCPGSGGSCPSMRTSRAPTSGAIDCADTTAARSPAVAEACNGVDDDCDTLVDEGTLVHCYVDADRDGFASAGATHVDRCITCMTGETPNAPVAGAIDCDDTTAARSPVVPEICNMVDDDCDGMVDDGFSYVMRYVDADGDGYGTGTVMSVCPSAGGYATVAGDCEDANFDVHPGQGQWFDTPICPAGESVCTMGTGNARQVGCTSGGVGCGINPRQFDYDCDRAASTETDLASCTSPGGFCSAIGGVCSGATGFVLGSSDTRPGDACGGPRRPGGCGCVVVSASGTCQVRAAGSVLTNPDITIRCH